MKGRNQMQQNMNVTVCTNSNHLGFKLFHEKQEITGLTHGEVCHIISPLQGPT